MKKVAFTNKRNCPSCGKELVYKNNYACYVQEQNKRICVACSNIKKGKNLDYRKKLSESLKNRLFSEEHKKNISKWHKGKKLSEEHKNSIKKGTIKHFKENSQKSIYEYWLDTYGKEEADKKYKEWISSKKGQKAWNKGKSISKGKSNPMYEKNVYDLWVKKYGQQISNCKYIDMIQKQSKSSSGKNNAMYGKPSPLGSGNGWSGWYKSYYFRSILELSYLKYLIDNNISFESSEKTKFKIEYYDSYKKKIRNYFPDFYISDTKEVIEIKPKKLVMTQQNKDKFKYAKIKYGNKFKVLTENDISKIDVSVMKKVHDSKDLIFLNKYEEKFQKWIINK